jgi:hypothetical protein
MDKILANALRAHPDITVTDLSHLNCCRPGLLPAFLQDGRDVHGSHGLFYWLRARQRGLVVSQERRGRSRLAARRRTASGAASGR